ncbi:MAG: DUF2283 domain-containing protein [Candidatus Woesearchaeota archaeon]
MTATYDSDADALYLEYSDAEIERTEKLDDNTILDFDGNGNIVGVELLFVSERNPSLAKKLAKA